MLADGLTVLHKPLAQQAHENEAMADAVREYTVEIFAIVQRIQNDLEAAAAATCGQPIVVSKRLWCTGERMCHKTCMLQVWYRETGDEMFQERARVCGGRCMAWDILSPESLTDDAEQWNGHFFRHCRDVVGVRLGYHDPRCPLREERNTSNHKVRIKNCEKPVLDTRQAQWIRKVQATLSGIEKFTAMQTTDFLKMSLRVECILHVLKAHAWGSSGCAAQHVVDPFNVSPLTVHCQRKGDSFSVTRALQHVRRELLTLFEVLSTAVVLGGRFSAKGCALLPVPLISRPGEEEDVTESLPQSRRM